MTTSALSHIASIVLAIEKSTNMHDIFQHIRTFTQNFGYDRFVLYTVSTHDKNVVIGQLLWLEGEWFTQETALTPEIYMARCPINQHILKTEQAFFWTKRQQHQHETYQIVKQPKGTGVHGLQVPIFGINGLMGALSFGGTQIDSNIETQLALTLLAHHAFHRLKKMNKQNFAHLAILSKRELEVMRWIASGQKQNEIASQLGLSTRTIENHLRRIRQRLGATSTSQALHILIREHQLEF